MRFYRNSEKISSFRQTNSTANPVRGGTVPLAKITWTIQKIRKAQKKCFATWTLRLLSFVITEIGRFRWYLPFDKIMLKMMNTIETKTHNPYPHKILYHKCIATTNTTMFNQLWMMVTRERTRVKENDVFMTRYGKVTVTLVPPFQMNWTASLDKNISNFV